MDTNNATKINDNDNVVVALRNITAGEEIFGVKQLTISTGAIKWPLLTLKKGKTSLSMAIQLVMLHRTLRLANGTILTM